MDHQQAVNVGRANGEEVIPTVCGMCGPGGPGGGCGHRPYRRGVDTAERKIWRRIAGHFITG